jgi:hypothetical protein
MIKTALISAVFYYKVNMTSFYPYINVYMVAIHIVLEVY